MTIIDPVEVDTDRLHAFIGQMVGDIGATLSACLVLLGDRLGLYRAMADSRPVSAEELAQRTGTSVAYLHPWLGNQATAGYLTYDPATETWTLPPEQAMALADETSPAFFAASMQLVVATLADLNAIECRFRTGEGFAWHEHNPGVSMDADQFFRPGHVANRPSNRLPAAAGVVAVSQLALEGASLEADLRFQLTETRQARTRLLQSGLEQRRQLERDLHDGAQQHLLAVAMRLGAAETLAGDPATAEAVRLARKELGEALAELRHLAHGIYPAELSQSGLRAALETVTGRLPIVAYLNVPDRRWAADVESAAYFIGCEALTNAAKHAAPCTVWLDVRELDSAIQVTIHDNGQGTAVLNSPRSLPGLRERLAALGGHLQVHSDQQGSIVKALIPCG